MSTLLDDIYSDTYPDSRKDAVWTAMSSLVSSWYTFTTAALESMIVDTKSAANVQALNVMKGVNIAVGGVLNAIVVTADELTDKDSAFRESWWQSARIAVRTAIDTAAGYGGFLGGVSIAAGVFGVTAGAVPSLIYTSHRNSPWLWHSPASSASLQTVAASQQNALSVRNGP